MRPNTPNTATKLTPRQRLTRGLTHTAAGPVDVTRGVVGIGVHSARAGAASLRRRYRESRLAREVAAAPETIAKELAAAQGAVSGLPQTLQRARRPEHRSRRPWVIAGVAAVLLAGGAAAFVIIRRSSRPDEPSPRPPSVDVQPRP
ncbi:MAG: cell wall synthesis protein CwsA [Mycobacterium sp.]